MSEASPQPQRPLIEQLADASVPSARDIMKAAGEYALTRSDEAYEATGLLAGALAGGVVVLGVEGQDTHPKQSDNQGVLDATKKEVGHHHQRYVHDYKLQLGEAGTIAGFMAVGVAAAAVFKARRAKRAEG